MNPFDAEADRYDLWFESDEGKAIFEIEKSGLRMLIPRCDGRRPEVGVGTGRFAEALGISDGVVASLRMPAMTAKRGIDTGVHLKKTRKIRSCSGIEVYMTRAAVLFLFAGLAEIGGGYLVWLWLREGKPYWYGIIGGIILFLYGIIPTMQSFPDFGRVYAAYGGVFVVLSLLWGWGIDRKTPDLCDWLGAAICLAGIYVILWGPRNQ